MKAWAHLPTLGPARRAWGQSYPLPTDRSLAVSTASVYSITVKAKKIVRPKEPSKSRVRCPMTLWTFNTYIQTTMLTPKLETMFLRMIFQLKVHSLSWVKSTGRLSSGIYCICNLITSEYQMLLRGFTSPSAPFIARLICKHLPKPVFSMRAGTVLCSCWHLCPKCPALRRCTVNVL